MGHRRSCARRRPLPLRTSCSNLWRETLTLQFHDIIPGSSIAWVYDDAEEAYARIIARLEELRDESLRMLAAGVAGRPALMVANASASPTAMVIETSSAGVGDHLPGDQLLSDGSLAIAVETVAPLGIGPVQRVDASIPASVTLGDDDVVLANGIIYAIVDDRGRLTSVFDQRCRREMLLPGTFGNEFELSADHPVEYDAWDLDPQHLAVAAPLDSDVTVEVGDAGPLVASLIVSHSFGASTLRQRIVLRAGSPRLDFVTEVDWQENEKVLKVAMPVDVHAANARCEIQFGHVERPRHASNSWDAAKFEVCAHRWVDVSEPGFGVALLNDCKYGYDLQRAALRLTLLRSPNYPDPQADRGQQRFTYSLLAHDGDVATIRAEADRLNQPPRVFIGSADPSALVSVSDPSLVITAVKLAEDRSGDVIVRCFESAGARQMVTLNTAFEFSEVEACDFLEDPYEAHGEVIVSIGARAVGVMARPFQIVTLRFQR